MKLNNKPLVLGIKITALCLVGYSLSSNSAWAQACSKTNINSYVKKLNNTNEWIFTIAALRKCDSPAVAALAARLQNKDDEARFIAASALGSMGKVAQPAIPALIAALNDPSVIVRSSATTALSSISVETKTAIPAFTKALGDEDESVRSIAAAALGSMGVEAQTAIPSLTKALNDPSELVRSSAIFALGKIATGFRYQAKTLSSSQLNSIILNLEAALKVIQNSPAKSANLEIKFFNQSLQLLKAERDDRWFERLSTSIVDHKLIAIAFIYLVSLISLWQFILWLRPLWLLNINNSLKKYTSFSLPGVASIEVPVRHLLLVGLFNSHPKVIDAWFKRQITLTQPAVERTGNTRLLVNFQALVNSSTEFDHATIRRYAKAVAWECLKQNYQSSAVKRNQVLATIAAMGGNDPAEKYLLYLETRLGIIQSVGKAQDSIRFTHDLLAENLASLYLVELCGNNEANWRKFLAQIDSISNAETVKGFLLAVRDCSLAWQKAAKVPNFVPVELTKRIVPTKLTEKAQAV